MLELGGERRGVSEFEEVVRTTDLGQLPGFVELVDECDVVGDEPGEHGVGDGVADGFVAGLVEVGGVDEVEVVAGGFGGGEECAEVGAFGCLGGVEGGLGCGFCVVVGVVWGFGYDGWPPGGVDGGHGPSSNRLVASAAWAGTTPLPSALSMSLRLILTPVTWPPGRPMSHSQNFGDSLCPPLGPASVGGGATLPRTISHRRIAGAYCPQFVSPSPAPSWLPPFASDGLPSSGVSDGSSRRGSLGSSDRRSRGSGRCGGRADLWSLGTPSTSRPGTSWPASDAHSCPPPSLCSHTPESRTAGA